MQHSVTSVHAGDIPAGLRIVYNPRVPQWTWHKHGTQQEYQGGILGCSHAHVHEIRARSAMLRINVTATYAVTPTLAPQPTPA